MGSVIARVIGGWRTVVIAKAIRSTTKLPSGRHTLSVLTSVVPMCGCAQGGAASTQALAHDLCMQPTHKNLDNRECINILEHCVTGPRQVYMHSPSRRITPTCSTVPTLLPHSIFATLSPLMPSNVRTPFTPAETQIHFEAESLRIAPSFWRIVASPARSAGRRAPDFASKTNEPPGTGRAEPSTTTGGWTTVQLLGALCSKV